MQNATVLIVEDEQITALDLEQSLISSGYDVVGKTASGEGALEKASNLLPDVVLMDITLEGPMDGVEAGALIHDRFGIPIVYLTAHSDERTIERAQITEPLGYLVKPLKLSDVHAAIQVALYKDRDHHKALENQRATLAKRGAGSSLGGVPEKMAFFRALDLFATLSEADLEQFASACESRRVSAGEQIIRAGEENPAAFIVVNGRIAFIKNTTTGKRFFVEMLPSGDLLGLTAAVEKGAAPLNVCAQIDSEILWIPKSTFVMLLDSHPVLARRFSEYLISRLRRSHEFSLKMAHAKVPVRIASALLALLPHSNQMKDGDPGLRIKITRQELADIVGAAVETVVRTTKQFERDGILSLGLRKKIIVRSRTELEKRASTE